MVRKRRATPTSGPDDDANPIPVRSSGKPRGACRLSNLKPESVKVSDLKISIFLNIFYILVAEMALLLTHVGAMMVLWRCVLSCSWALVW
jgi:hypothetical protein